MRIAHTIGIFMLHEILFMNLMLYEELGVVLETRHVDEISRNFSHIRNE